MIGYLLCMAPISTKLEKLKQQAAELPIQPGVYIFRDGKKKAIYIGKAISIRARVRQYISGHDERLMVPFLVRNASTVEAVVTRTEKEALLLESELIKRHKPKYNINLRDDKNFLHVRVDTRSKWPRYELVRRTKRDGAKYFGPYTSAARVRTTLTFLHRIFPLRTCTDAVLRTRTRPCLLHQMERCVAPCVDLVDSQAYDELVDGSLQLLRGNRRSVIAKLKKEMMQAAAMEEYERAARMRDLMQALQATLESQAVVDPRRRDRDVWGVHRVGDRGTFTLLQMREGALGEPRRFPPSQLVASDAELLSTTLNTFYQSEIPGEILVPFVLADAEALEAVFSDRAGHRVKLHVPQRGELLRLIKLAQRNAELSYEQATDEQARHDGAMLSLARLLELEQPPRRIECFDNSNIQGEHPVAAMSVFLDGKPARSEYRRYKVKTVVGADDYATMREILRRRLRRAMDEGTVADLLVVDGGKGQVAAAQAVLEDMGLHDLRLIGIAKPKTERRRGERWATDKLVLPNRKELIRLEANHPGLRILQHLRDEVHKHAITYHRKVRRKTQLQSVLDMIPGVGPSRRKALLKTFGSAEGVAAASVDELSAVSGIGPELARTIHACLLTGSV